MIGIILRFALVLVGSLMATFTGVVVIVRAQPIPDTGARHFLSPDGITCLSAAPCFFGIQPGETSADDAFDLLGNHQWVDQFYLYRGMESDSGLVQWTWSGLQPPYINSKSPGSLWFQQSVVSWMEIDLNLTFGDIWLLFDSPQTGRVYMMSSTPPRAFQLVEYQNGSLQVRSEFSCPLHLTSFWRAAVRVTANSPSIPRLRTPSIAYRLPYPRECM
jgi:hypothetical protein